MRDVLVPMSFVVGLMGAIGSLMWLMDPFMDDLWHRMRLTTQVTSDISVPIGFIDRFMSDIGSPETFVDCAHERYFDAMSFVDRSMMRHIGQNELAGQRMRLDRKSTRLNSSHT